MICSALGNCCSNARDLGAIISCAQFPPSQSRTHAEGHDQGMREVMVTLLKGLPGDGQGSGAPVGFTAHEDDGFRPSISSQNFPRCFLGVMGRRSLHDSDSSSRDRGRSDETDGCEKGHRLSRRVARVDLGPQSERVCRTTMG